MLIAAEGGKTFFSDVELAQLRRLVNQAFELRGSPYLRDGCQAIVDLHVRTLPDRLERHARQQERQR